MRILLFLILSFGTARAFAATCRIAGRVTDRETGEALIGCNVVIRALGIGTATDSAGFYSLAVSPGSHLLTFSHLGYDSLSRRVAISEADGERTVNIALRPMAIAMQEVNIEERAPEPAPAVQHLERTDVQRVPTVYRDPLRAMSILPGVSSNNELSSGYNVRGGNYDENLVYLNGYEIYRPQLLRYGEEESQSLVNTELVERLEFYGAAYPVVFGDKLSSVLEVDYAAAHNSRWGGTVHADLLGQGMTVYNRAGRLDWSLGTRYVNPGLFVSRLQTSGSYRPRFADDQIFATYSLAKRSRLTLFALSAANKFKLTPETWEGNFTGRDYTDVKAVRIEYDGERNYSVRTDLAGLRLDRELGSNARWSLGGSYLRSTEREDSDLRSDIYYDDNAWEGGPAEYLKSETEANHNRLTLDTYQVMTALRLTQGAHEISLGMEARAMALTSRTHEYAVEVNAARDSNVTVNRAGERDLDLNSAAVYARSVTTLSPAVKLDLGVRALQFAYTDETLFSPRTAVYYESSSSQRWSAAVGYYYQPPFYHELRDIAKPKSQLAVHYLLGWEHEASTGLTARVEGFYKDLRRIIPYTVDGPRIEYLEAGTVRGYAYGMDFLLRGELTERINSWISYGYLSTREQKPRASGYERRLLDQTHTLRFFLQDKMPSHPNVQVHNRILFGSGYLYHPQITEIDSAGGAFLTVDESRSEALPFYFRADIGFSVRLQTGQRTEATIVAEVLNAFNRANAAGYRFYTIHADDAAPVRTAEVLSGRFFNLALELRLK